ncbi:HNH endonuclease [Parasphingorhabdus halotolerans]|uniref:HNH endonuclease n=1 Tax=Parasphingorhabdus halotolerans TaxID=2725558 RepID=A0A6H2DPZ2_9SPHN|nr:HNH endonuclease [Parasphingorhabdus halotolerans]QJB70268.1 HNH endonuclease [Parasphingorhabdus halotolerans]
MANTDPNWFDYLAAHDNIDEVNFWQPSGHAKFGAVSPGELFLFKLKAPRNVIGGFGVLSQASNLPLSLAWDAMGTKNGAASFDDMRARVGQYRKEVNPAADCVIGCRIVVQPVFFPQELWIPQPDSWANSIVVGKTYDTETTEGMRLWEALQNSATQMSLQDSANSSYLKEGSLPFSHKGSKFGAPTLIKPRLGQGAFRLAVTDAYRRECGISHGRVLPALDAAHIRPYGQGGEHEVQNGILLRKDIHSVFDAGYVTFDDELKLVVSDRVRTDFNNGNEYRRLHGSQLAVPEIEEGRPSLEHIQWHQNQCFLG